VFWGKWSFSTATRNYTQNPSLTGEQTAGIIAVVLLHNALPVRYLILAPIVNLMLAGLLYRVARNANLDQS
jgi:hypothetical protein